MRKWSHFNSKKHRKILVFAFAALFSQSIWAQTGGGAGGGTGGGSIIAVLNAIRASLNAIVNTAATYIFQTPSNVGKELLTNYTLHNTAIKTVGPNISNLNADDIKNSLNPQTDNPTKNLAQLSIIQASDSVLSSSMLGGAPLPFFSSGTQSTQQNALMQGNLNFSFESLISPLVYSQDTQNYAMNFIRFISGYGFPISNLNLNAYPETQLSNKQKLKIQDTPSYQLYQVQRRQLVAQQSVALSNLYWIYSRRLPDQKIQASDTGIGTPNPSVAQIENFNATWRTSTPTWYAQMGTASPSNVEREILFVLAEIRTELHRLHEDNERIIALQAIGQLGAVQTGKQTLSITEKQVLQDINNEIKSAMQPPAGQETNQQQGKKSQLQQTETRIKQEQAGVAGRIGQTPSGR